MRTTVLLLAAVLSVPAAARAADLPARPPAAVAYPVAAPVVMPVVAVAMLVARPLPLERSRFTGQPITVVFNNPGSLPGAVDPGLTLVPLPTVPRFHTKAAYPRGY